MEKKEKLSKPEIIIFEELGNGYFLDLKVKYNGKIYSGVVSKREVEYY